MADNVVYLFPDTNLFIQCRPLDQLDWSDWLEFDQVNLIVCRPVQREIDSRKNRGNDRAAKRSRKTYRIFRRIIESNDEFLQVSDASPRVRLFLEAPSLPSTDLKDVLDYSKPDDEIVGCLYRFIKENQNEDARLLTHDTGPLLTAETHGLRVDLIKDEWLLRPEHNESETEIARLRQRVAILEQTEPNFLVSFLNDDQSEIESWQLEYRVYDPLSVDEISSFMESLKKLFPLVSDFGSREPAEKAGDSSVERPFHIREIYRPATDEAICKYTDKEYPEWIDRCEEALSLLHVSLQGEIGQPAFTFTVLNDGTRPGKDTLVRISAKGNFKIRPLHSDESDSPETDEERRLSLPKAPQAPRGKWIRRVNWLNPYENFANEIGNLTNRMTNPYHSLSQLPTRLPNIEPVPRHDPNAFYYKPARPTRPQKSISLECEQWRHATEAEHFIGQIYPDIERDVIQGALTCEVHAENLSGPMRKTIPVEITIRRISSAERARTLIQDLADSAE
ncbi:MAG: PIN domain-containing protein [Gemmatimonadota bacterium]|nr:PIN domain-containing protein [Gemmatimonadota bacterium]